MNKPRQEKVTCPPGRSEDLSSIILKWYVNNGDIVKKGDALLRLDSGDHFCEVEASIAGGVFGIIHSEGANVQPNELLCVLKV